LFSPFSTAAGEFVEADEIVARIETDKVTVDITAPVAGVIKSYFAAEGDTVEVGADFYELDTDATGGSAAPATPAAPKAAAAEAPKVSKTTQFINLRRTRRGLLLCPTRRCLNILNIIYPCKPARFKCNSLT
jgi:pyruvate/2-oxoglutarate dehydrogenase complex dihydrolipoamide acyltransferase (E2) component